MHDRFCDGQHARNSYHNFNEAFDITHWKGTRLDSIEKTRQLKEAIRSLGLFEEIIGPGDGDPNHLTSRSFIVSTFF